MGIYSMDIRWSSTIHIYIIIYTMDNMYNIYKYIYNIYSYIYIRIYTYICIYIYTFVYIKWLANFRTTCVTTTVFWSFNVHISIWPRWHSFKQSGSWDLVWDLGIAHISWEITPPIPWTIYHGDIPWNSWYSLWIMRHFPWIIRRFQYWWCDL